MADDALADEEAGEQVHVVAGRAHRDRQRAPRDPHLQRLFGDECVGDHARRLADGQPGDLPAYRHPAHGPSLPHLR